MHHTEKNTNPTETSEIPVQNATGTMDYHDAASEEAHACAKELATVLLEKKFNKRKFVKLTTRLESLNYEMSKIQSCMLSRFTMSVALGMAEGSPDYAAWREGLQRLGAAAFAIEKAAQEARNLRAKHDGDSTALRDAVFATFFSKGDIPR